MSSALRFVPLVRFAEPFSGAPHAAPVRTLVTMPSIPVGVGMTCRSILSSAAAAGFRTDLFTSRYTPDARTQVAVRTALPSSMALVPYRLTRKLGLTGLLHAAYLRDLREGEIAYLWPSVPLQVFEAVSRRGNPIVIEAINTRMAYAKALLDAAYEEAGLKPAHGITEARIADQDARLSLAATIFAPSPATEAALAGTPLANRFIPSSYGTWVPPSVPVRPRRRPGDTVRFLFVGNGSVRKGIPRLLAAWERLPESMHLRLVGDLEPGVAARFGHVLGRPNISHRPFTLDTQAEYEKADVFIQPAIEEGDSIVTYEAAAAGLPIIASAAGAGRIGADSGAIEIVDTADCDRFRDRLAAFAASDELRRHWGDLARQAVVNYDWSVIGPARFAALHAFLRA